MRLTREQREELRRRIDEEKRKTLQRWDTLSLARNCLEATNQNPELALLLAVRFMRQHPEIVKPEGDG